jgi:hypothetical protein
LGDDDFLGVYNVISETSSFTAVKQIAETLRRKVKVVVVLPCAHDMCSEWFDPQFSMAFQVLVFPNQRIGESICLGSLSLKRWRRE